MNTIAIYGAGGLGREILAFLHSFQGWRVIGFYDDIVAKGSVIDGVEVKGGCEDLKKLIANVVIAIGDPKMKEKALTKLKEGNGLQFPVLIHPSATLLSEATIQIGSGSVITAGCVLTTGISIGNHVLINLNCTVGHDVMIGDCASIMPNVSLAGKVTIGKSVLIGSGVQIINEVKIGEYATVGSGSVVTKDVQSDSTVVGVPARKIHV